jgi:putative transposase
VFEDHVKRRFHADAPDRLWFTDITQHRTGEGWVYCAVVLDVFSRRVVGWSIADHLRTELVADALDMARLQRRPPPQQTILHSDRGTQYTSWLFGKRMRDAGLMGSMGAVGSAYDCETVGRRQAA